MSEHKFYARVKRYNQEDLLNRKRYLEYLCKLNYSESRLKEIQEELDFVKQELDFRLERLLR